MPIRHLQVDAVKSLFDDIIDRNAEAYLSAYPEVKEFNNFEKSGTINYYIGMVWTNDNEKPDIDSIRIRGSYSLTKNKMLELDLSGVDQLYSFFPGQVVAFSADPYLKRQLAVRKFLDPMKIAPPMKKINTDDNIKLFIASGPYMEPEHEDWTLLESIIENIKSNEATHVILIGPFIDMENKPIKTNYESNWKILFGKLIEGLYENNCQVYLVPSTRDILCSNLSSNFFYPCSSLNIDIQLKEGAKPKCSLKSVQDPSQIDLGGLYVDVTSAETLFHLHKCTSFINRGQSNMFNSLFRHVITHGIYPIYPPPCDIAVDYPSLSEHLKLDRLGPHIIVLPTKFTTSVSNVENRLVVTIHKCCVKKHAVLLDIPKIESSEDVPVKSIYEVEFKNEIINLVDNSILGSQLSNKMIADQPILAIESTPVSELNSTEEVRMNCEEEKTIEDSEKILT